MDGTSNKLIVADTDALIALTNRNDLLHKQAIDISKKLIQEKALVLFPTTSIAEAASKFQRVFSNKKLALQLLEKVYQDEEFIIEIDRIILKVAREYFKQVKSKKNTLFDCIVAAVAKKYNAKAIFSFDRWYKTLGFTIAYDLSEIRSVH